MIPALRCYYSYNNLGSVTMNVCGRLVYVCTETLYFLVRVVASVVLPINPYLWYRWNCCVCVCVF